MAVLLELVRGQVARALGHADGDSIEPLGSFQSMGFDSLTAVEVRNTDGPSRTGWAPASVSAASS